MPYIAFFDMIGTRNSALISSEEYKEAINDFNNTLEPIVIRRKRNHTHDQKNRKAHHQKQPYIPVAPRGKHTLKVRPAAYKTSEFQ